MRRFAGLILLVASSGALSSETENAAATLCAESETALFSCPVGAKILSLCASSPLTPDSGYVQYRFGSAAKVELEFPGSKVHPRNSLTLFGSGFARGYVAHLNFNVGAYTYVVYDRLVGAFQNGRPEGHDHYAGVIVAKRGKVVSRLPCSDTSGGRFQGSFEGIIPDGGGYEYWWFADI